MRDVGIRHDKGVIADPCYTIALVRARIYSAKLTYSCVLTDNDTGIDLVFITDILWDIAYDRIAKYTRVIADPRLAKHPSTLLYRDVVAKDCIFTYKGVGLDICVISNDRSIFYNGCLVDIFHCISFS